MMSFSGHKSGWAAAYERSKHKLRSYITSDGGERWTSCGNSFAEQQLYPLAASFATQQKGWALVVDRSKPALDRSIVRTTDAGCTWEAVWRDPGEGENGMLNGIDFATAEVGWTWSQGTLHGTILATSDGGRHWYKLAFRGNLRGARALSSVCGWVAASSVEGVPVDAENSGLFYTADAGKHWSAVTRSQIRKNEGLARAIPRDWGMGALMRMKASHENAPQ